MSKWTRLLGWFSVIVVFCVGFYVGVQLERNFQKSIIKEPTSEVHRSHKIVPMPTWYQIRNKIAWKWKDEHSFSQIEVLSRSVRRDTVVYSVYTDHNEFWWVLLECNDNGDWEIVGRYPLLPEIEGK